MQQEIDDDDDAGRSSRLRIAALCLALLSVTLSAVWYTSSSERHSEDKRVAIQEVVKSSSIEQAIRLKCATCHRFSEPSILPKDIWEDTIRDMFDIDKEGILSGSLDMQETIDWFVSRAPIEVFAPGHPVVQTNNTLEMKRREIGRSAAGIATQVMTAGSVSNVQVHNFNSDSEMRIVATDMAHGQIMISGVNEADDGFRVVANVPHPARSSMVDLDKDGRLDFLVADLGSFRPEEHTRGQAIWIRARGEGTFTKHVLKSGFGRVADVEAADFDNDGDLDVVVGEFGSRDVGGVWLLENVTSDWKEPRFNKILLGARGGPVQTVLGDIDNDGSEDIVVLRAEHYEDVTVHLSRDGLTFETRIVFQAPHPAWGYTGLELIDFNRDGSLDMLLTNGDGFDAGGVLHPFHGVQLFLNNGEGEFRAQPLMPFRGVHRAEAGDMDGDGDLDIVACAFHPFLPDEGRRNLKLDALIWFEQVTTLSFERHVIEALNVDCPSLDLKDFDGDGDLDITTGVFQVSIEDSEDTWASRATGEESPVAITWENLLTP